MYSPDHMPKVLIAAPVHDVLIDGLKEIGYQCVMQEQITQATALGLVGDCEGIITSTRLQLDRELIDAAPRLRWIGRMGSGMEVIDVAYAAQKGITCHGSPEGNCNAVGEHALGMLLALVRRITWAQCEMQAGVWKRDENRGIELEGKTVGIIGYGHTGQAFAKKLRGFDVRIMAYDKYRTAPVPTPVEACTDIADIYREADIVSFHVPLQADTVHYCNEAFIAAMQKPFILVNTSRGQVVDTPALHNALLTGKVIGACLDVFEQEPITKAQGELRNIIGTMIRMPNVILTPHIAGYTHEALYKMSHVLLQKIAGKA
ncbi:2-hydroxyacid dehydrogenase [Nemorincola caseinilytica]|uniref:2-hydroxyacid dehydrogenase n=1 Tax=Nemorincola caseinilytica TaxID=2054315 RepID=A0ABP8NBQ1_9BACT